MIVKIEYRARYYNPTTGRFLSEDPLGFAGSGPNLYAYAGNDPIDFVDPSGLDKRKKIMCAGKAGLPVALDAASLVADVAGPEGQVAKVGLGMGLGLASTVTSASNGDVQGSLLGIAGFQRAPIEVAAKDAGMGGAKWIPGVGIAMDAYATYHDVSGMSETYNACMATP